MSEKPQFIVSASALVLLVDAGFDRVVEPVVVIDNDSARNLGQTLAKR